jgi:hypothetical protein
MLQKCQIKEPEMRNRPKMPQKMMQKPQSPMPKVPPKAKKQPGPTFIYKKDAFNKVKIT